MKDLHRPSIRTLIALAVAVGFALAEPGSAGTTRHGDKMRPVDVTFVDEAGVQIDRSDCESQPGVCEIYYHGSGTLSGDAAGTAEYVGHGHYEPDGSFTYTNVVTPDETKSACGGAGTFEFDEENVLSPLDPPQLGLAGIGEWKINRGSGTGAFKGATGSGFIVVVQQDNKIRARFLGAINCRR
jgi:hypothetical protein